MLLSAGCFCCVVLYINVSEICAEFLSECTLTCRIGQLIAKVVLSGAWVRLVHVQGKKFPRVSKRNKSNKIKH